MGADLLKSDFHLPALHQPDQDCLRLCLQISALRTPAVRIYLGDRAPAPSGSARAACHCGTTQRCRWRSPPRARPDCTSVASGWPPRRFQDRWRPASTLASGCPFYAGGQVAQPGARGAVRRALRPTVTASLLRVYPTARPPPPRPRRGYRQPPLFRAVAASAELGVEPAALVRSTAGVPDPARHSNVRTGRRLSETAAPTLAGSRVTAPAASPSTTGGRWLAQNALYSNAPDRDTCPWRQSSHRGVAPRYRPTPSPPGRPAPPLRRACLTAVD